MKRNSPIVLTGIIGAVIAIALVFVNILISPWFSWSSSALSDLGVHKYGFIFNSALIFEAVMNTIFMAYLIVNHSPKKSSVAIIIASIFLGLVGVFNEHFGIVHFILAAGYFFLFPLAIFPFSYLLRKDHSGFFYSSTIIGIFSLAIIIVGLIEDLGIISFRGIGFGVFEMGEALLLAIWASYLSVATYVGKVDFGKVP